MNLKHRDVWRGEYRDIHFEINRFESYDKTILDAGWTFYLYLMLETFPEDQREAMRPKYYFTAFGSPMEVPRDNPLENLKWHGGMTWISDESKKGSPFTQIKVGCDYQHLWDEHQFYSLEGIEREVKLCIDSLYEYRPPNRTPKQVWDEFRAKFPGDKAGDHRTFDIDGKPIDFYGTPAPSGDERGS